MLDNLPTILGFFGVAITVVVNLILGIIKARQDKLSANKSTEGEFRDDLLLTIEKLNARLDNQDEKIDQLNQLIDTLRKENNAVQREKFNLELRVAELESEKKKLEIKVTELQDILHSFESKVYYRGTQK